MAYITDDLIAYLGAHTSITPLITTDPLHIFSSAVPETAYTSAGKEVRIGETYILVIEDGGIKERTMDGFTGTREVQYTIRVTAPTKLAIRRIFKALDVALEIQNVTMGDWCADHAFLDDPEDTSSTKSDGSGALTLEMTADLEMMGRLTS